MNKYLYKSIVLCLLVALFSGITCITYSDVLDVQFRTFQIAYKKEYKSSMELEHRLKIFLDNSYNIAKHNQLFEMGLVHYKLAINEFADLTHKEFTASYNGLNRSAIDDKFMLEKGTLFIPPANIKLPQEFDWRWSGAVTRVKNQQQCGSCWSFSATGSLEGQYFRKTGELLELSEQNLVDCSWGYGNNGCGGGWMPNAFQYIQDNGGIDTESSYPYEASEGECRYDPGGWGATDSGFSYVNFDDEYALLDAVGSVGPIAVAIDASVDTFQFYSSGVYSDSRCDPGQLNHAVLVVGYGSEDGQDYWLVKNSWGESWGDGGYIKMGRNQGNVCGIAARPSYPNV